MKSFAIGLMVSAMLTGPVSAQCYSGYRPRAYYPTYSTPTYSYSTKYEVVKEVVKEVPTFIKYQAVIPYAYALVNVLPTYGAQYVPPAYPSFPHNGVPQQPGPGQTPSQTPGQPSELQQVLNAINNIGADVKDLKTRIQVLEDKYKSLPAPRKQVEPKEESSDLPKEVSLKEVNKNHCAFCHERGKESNGGGLVLSEKDGIIVKLTIRQIEKLLRNIEFGTMPPNDQHEEAAVVAVVKEHKIKPLDNNQAIAWKREAFRQLQERKKEASEKSK